jgi:hypothetical protein
MDFLYALVALVGAHYVADFAMQNDYVATAKAKVHTAPDGIHALTAHAIHHVVASAVLLGLLGLPWLLPALVVGATHWLIDYGKSVRGWYGYHADQSLHLLVVLAVAAGTSISVALGV